MLEGSLASVKILAAGTDTTVRGRSKYILMFKMTEDEMVRWHHRLNGREFEQTPGDNEGQESLVCCSSCCCRVGNKLTTEWMNKCLFIHLPFMSSLVAQLVRNPPAMRETWVRSLGWEDPLVKGKATHSRILAWAITGTEEPGGLQSVGSHGVKYNWATDTHMQCLPNSILK